MQTLIFYIGLSVGLAAFGPMAAAEVNKSIPENLGLAATGEAAVKKLPEGWKILQFWASWCATCDQTMVRLDSLANDKLVDEHSLIPVSVDEQCSDVESYFSAKPHVGKFKDQVRRDPGGELAKKLNLKGIPTVMLVNPEGEVVSEFVGHPSEAQLDVLRRHLQHGKTQQDARDSH